MRFAFGAKCGLHGALRMSKRQPRRCSAAAHQRTDGQRAQARAASARENAADSSLEQLRWCPYHCPPRISARAARFRSISQFFDTVSSKFNSTLAIAVCAASSTTSSDLSRGASPCATNSSAAAGDWR